MSGLANLNSHDTGSFTYPADAPTDEAYPDSDYHVTDRPEPISQRVPGAVLDRPVGVNDRPQQGWIAYFLGGQRRWWSRYTGEHGIIGEARPAPNLEGGQQAWPNWNRRTFRNAPLVPWDEGSEI